MTEKLGMHQQTCGNDILNGIHQGAHAISKTSKRKND
jgi:hypothetical protein